jgi:hypothetical protein
MGPQTSPIEDKTRIAGVLSPNRTLPHLRVLSECRSLDFSPDKTGLILPLTGSLSLHPVGSFHFALDSSDIHEENRSKWI